MSEAERLFAIQILFPIASSIADKSRDRYAHRAPLTFRAMMTIPQSCDYLRCLIQRSLEDCTGFGGCVEVGLVTLDLLGKQSEESQ
jgi:hypothetical protein